MKFRRPQLVLVSAFLCALFNGLIIVALPLIGKGRLGAEAWVLGLYGSASAPFYVLTAWLSGGFLSRHTSKRMIQVGLGILISGALLSFVCQQKFLLTIPFIVTNAGFGLFWPALEAALCEGQNSAQTKRGIGLFSFSWMSGLACGAFLAGYLYTIDHNIPLVLGLFIEIVILLLVSLPGTMAIAPWGSPVVLDHEGSVSPSKRKMFIYLAFIGNLALMFANGVFRSLLPEYQMEAGLTSFQYGLWQWAFTFGMFSTNLTLLLWHGWHYSLRFFFGIQGFGVILLIGLSIFHSFPLLLGLSFLLGIPLSLTYFSSIYYGLEQVEEKGTHSGNHEAIIGMGSVLGPILGTAAMWITGYSRGCLILSAIVIAGMLVFQAQIVRGRSRQNAMEAMEEAA